MRRFILTLLLLVLVAACGGGGPAPEEEAVEAGPVAVGVARVFTLAGNGEVGTTEGPALEASFDEPVELVLDEEGNIYVVEYHGARVSKITADGMVIAVVDNPTGNVDGSKEEARLGMPRGIVLAGDGNLYISDWENRSVRRVTLDGTVTTIFERSFVETLALMPDGDILVSMGPDREQISRITLDGEMIPVAGSPQHGGHKDGPAEDAQFTLVSGVAVDEDGQIYVTEAVSLRSRGGNHLIRVISPDGEANASSPPMWMGRLRMPDSTIPWTSRWMQRGTSTWRTRSTTASAVFRLMAWCPPWQAGAAMRATPTAWATKRSSTCRRAWRWMPRATSTSPTPATTAFARSFSSSRV